jgi:hypothetical protein
MFRSVSLAGLEGPTGCNRHGQWFDHVVAACIAAVGRGATRHALPAAI